MVFFSFWLIQTIKKLCTKFEGHMLSILFIKHQGMKRLGENLLYLINVAVSLEHFLKFDCQMYQILLLVSCLKNPCLT